MKKLLAVFDGEHFSDGVFGFARRLNELRPALLTGVFLPSVDYTDITVYYLGGMTTPLYNRALDTDVEAMTRNKERFQELCAHHGMEFRIHEQISGRILEGIQKETRYADVLLLDSALFYQNLGETQQDDYLKDTMRRAECPVVLVPEHYDFPEQIILAYDGSESSVFAIKQFAYLFPELTSLRTLLTYVSPEGKDMPDGPYIQELASRHFSDLTFFNLEADPDRDFDTWVQRQKGSMLVAGGFGRSAVSELLKRNFAGDIIREGRLPVFIAHK
jgi:hypothetical protein